PPYQHRTRPRFTIFSRSASYAAVPGNSELRSKHSRDTGEYIISWQQCCFYCYKPGVIARCNDSGASTIINALAEEETEQSIGRVGCRLASPLAPWLRPGDLLPALASGSGSRRHHKPHRWTRLLY